MPPQSLISKILPAFKNNILPAIFLQSFAITLGLCYYFWPASHIVFGIVEQLKIEYGIWYALIATAIFGGIIPYSYLYFTGAIKNNPLGQCFFYIVFWAMKGIEADLFYRLQSFVFGDGNDILTIAKKTAVDQFIYAAFWIAPTISIAYLWKEKGFRLRGMRALMTREFLFERIPLIAVSNWLVWLPAVAVIYMMPPALQVPMFNLVVCFFVLMLAVLNKDS